MKLRNRVLLLALAVFGLVLVSGCMATRADEKYRQRYEESRKRAAEEAAKPIPEAPNLTGIDKETVARGKALFHGKVVCFGCHGTDGDITRVTNPQVATLNPRPTDLRKPSDKSVRQLYFIIKYGIPSTGMVPVQDDARLKDEEFTFLISYVLALQGTPLSQNEIFDQLHRSDGEADRTILTMCDAEAIGDTDARRACEHRQAKRYRDLLVGRPADIAPPRYSEIQASCKQRFGTDLDGLARCYRLEYTITRNAAK